jgi:hypothetical protein
MAHLTQAILAFVGVGAMLFLLMVMGKIAFSWAEAPSTPSQRIEQAFAASGSSRRARRVPVTS